MPGSSHPERSYPPLIKGDITLPIKKQALHSAGFTMAKKRGLPHEVLLECDTIGERKSHLAQGYRISPLIPTRKPKKT
jgi:hypothetical protein